MTRLVDPYNRAIEYVRLSVTDRCDLRCTYCLPEDFKAFDEPESWLTFDETERVVAAFARLGVRRIRLTGGEPLVRKNLPVLASRIAALPGIEDLSLSTNATRLDRQAADLKNAGVSRLNVSLDSLRPERFKAITRGRLDKVLKGLTAAKAAGFAPIKINMVVMKDVNDDEVGDMVAFCIEQGFTLRFIETMPMGDSGRHASRRYKSLDDVRRELENQYELVPGVMPGGGPARYVRVAGTDLRIGFITPISRHFCETCNRVRLGADGTLYLCLGQDDHLALRPLLRAGIDDAGLENALRGAIARKPERHEFREKPEQVLRFMSTTGG
jgi:cyclic pyranopterin phosphate synthase